jgi:flagellar assembly protein FliH
MEPTDQTMKPAVQFLFDTEFAPSPRASNEDAGAPEEDVSDEPPAPTFSEEELEQARKQAFTEGMASGHKQAQDSIEQQTAMAVGVIGERLAELTRIDQEARQTGVRDVTTLARAIATKVAGDLIDEAPLAVIEKVASESLSRLFGETDVIIRVCETLAESLRHRLDTADARGGFTGQLSVVGEPSLSGADCRIEWSNGMAERDSDAVWRDIRETIARFESDDEAPIGVHRAPADPPEPDVGSEVERESEAAPEAAPETNVEASPTEPVVGAEAPPIEPVVGAEAPPAPGDQPVAAPDAPPETLAEVLGPELREALARNNDDHPAGAGPANPDTAANHDANQIDETRS